MLIASVAASPASGATATYSNDEVIAIPATGTEGDAAPYPSNIAASGLPGTLTELTVKIEKFLHSYPDDIGVALVAPNGQAMSLMGDVGGNEPPSPQWSASP